MHQYGFDNRRVTAVILIYSAICHLPNKWTKTGPSLLLRSSFNFRLRSHKSCRASATTPDLLLLRHLGAFKFYWKLIPAKSLEIALSFLCKDFTGWPQLLLSYGINIERCELYTRIRTLGRTDVVVEKSYLRGVGTTPKRRLHFRFSPGI